MPHLTLLIGAAGRTAVARLRQLRDSGERGSETTEKVLWIALVVTLVLAVYAIFNDKILDKINNLIL